MRTTILLATVGLLAASVAFARPVKVESLTAAITPANAVELRALACRNFGRVVHVNITVDWSKENSDVETDGYRRLIFWDDKAEYLFQKGTFTGTDGHYKIDGWFKVVDGGMHQGMISDSFEAPPGGIASAPRDAMETPTTSTACATKTW